jgi:hypothetical protein
MNPPSGAFGIRKSITSGSHISNSLSLRAWGALPPLPPGATLVLTSVNVLGAGAHVFFQASGAGSIHLKVAQPGNIQLAPNTVVIGSAKDVQWNGKKLRVFGGAPALSIALSEASVRERPGGVATSSFHPSLSVLGEVA